MTINDEIIHLIQQHGPLTSAQLYDLSDLAETRKQIGNSLNRLKLKGVIQRDEMSRYHIIDDAAAGQSTEEPDPDDPLADTAEPDPAPAPDPAPVDDPVLDPRYKVAPDFDEVKDQLIEQGYGPRVVSIASTQRPAPPTDPWPDIHRRTQAVLDQLLHDDDIGDLLKCVIEIRDLALDKMLTREG